MSQKDLIRYGYCLLAIVLVGLRMEAQSPLVTREKHFDVFSGLTHPHVYQTFQDQRGIWWVIQANGLSAFDGHTFYPTQSWPVVANPRTVTIRTEDRAGRLWLRFAQGERYRFKVVQTEDRQVVPLEQLVPLERIADLSDVALDLSGNLLLATLSGEIWQQQPKGGWQLLHSGLTFPLAFCEPRQSTPQLWLTEAALDVAQRRFVSLGLNPPIHYTHPLKVANWAVAKNGHLWLMDQRGLVECYGQTLGSYQNWADVLPNYQPGFYWDYTNFGPDPARDRLWVEYRGRLWLMGLGQKKFQGALDEQSRPFLRTPAFHLQVDRYGTLWMGSIRGLSQVKVNSNWFVRIYWQDPTSYPDYLDHSTRSITAGPDGKIYFLSNQRFMVWDQATQVSKSLLYPINAISPACADQQDSAIWFVDQVLYRYDTQRGTFTRFPIPTALQKGLTWSILDRGDKLLIANTQGIVFFEKATQQYLAFQAFGSFYALQGAEVYAIEPIEDQVLLLLTNRGLYFWDLLRGITARYSDQSKGKYYLPAHNFRHGYRDPQGDFWLATSEGLLWWSPRQQRYRLFDRQAGLPNENLYAVYPDGRGFLWLSSDLGLIQWHMATESLRAYREQDGLTDNEFNRIAHYRAADSTLYFGSLNGITALQPRDFAYRIEPKKRSVLVLMEAYLDQGTPRGRQAILADYHRQKAIHLSAGIHNLDLRFAIPAGELAQLVKYFYRLGPTGREWQELAEPVLRLYGLGYGHYELEVKAHSADGLVESQRLIIPITIKRPVYLRSWFLFLLFTGAVMVGRLILQRRLILQQIRADQLEKELARRTERIVRDKQIIEKQAIQLQQQHEEKSRFFTNVTHEFRTPLALIQGPLQSVMSQAKLSKRDHQLLHIAHNNAQRLLGMVDEVLLLATIEHGKVHPQPESQRLDSYLAALIQEYQPLAQRAGLKLKLLSPLDPEVEGAFDAKLVRLILNNLLSNAIKYTPAGGEVLLLWEYTVEYLIIRVRDNGRGIPPGDLPHVFERFFQTTQTRLPAEGGTGIGLALAADLTELLGGKLTVESAIGAGSTFTLTLPQRIIGPTAPTISPLPEARKGKSTGGIALPKSTPSKVKCTILIVEDHEEFRQYLTYLLSDKYRVTALTSGREALTYLDENAMPALILSDLMMPEIDGFSLLQHIKGKSQLASVPFIFLTARYAESDRQRALALGANDYLIKPFDADALFAIVDTWAARYLQQKAAQEAGATEAVPLPARMEPSEAGAWLAQLKDLTEQHLSEEDFSVDRLAAMMLMGRTNFYKTVKKLTGMTPHQFILEARLLRARELVNTHSNLTIAKLTQFIGLKDENHFSQAFKKRFGHPPSWFM